MSKTKYHCGCVVEYDELDTDDVLNIRFCKKHAHIKNNALTMSENALNLEDAIYDEDEDDDEY